MDSETDRHRQTKREMVSETDKLIDKRTDRLTDKNTDDRQIDLYMQTDRWTVKQTDR